MGRRLAELEAELDFSVILYRGCEGIDLHPDPQIRLHGEKKELKDEIVRRAAIFQLEDASVIADLAKGALSEATCLFAAERLTDERHLVPTREAGNG